MSAKVDQMDPDFLAWLLDRCYVEEGEGGCWEWRLSLAHGKDPQARYRGKIILVRRVIYNATHTKPLGKNWLAVCKCDTEGCVHPDHLSAMSRSVAQRGIKRGHGAKVAQGLRARSKLTHEDVEDIRSMRESSAEAATRYGVSRDYVNQIRSHKVWRDYQSPFAGLFTGLSGSCA